MEGTMSGANGVVHGVVRGGVIVLDEAGALPEGASVEVRVASPLTQDEERAREDAFEQRLVALGRLRMIPHPIPDPPGLDRTPIDVPGRPLSEQIIEERR